MQHAKLSAILILMVLVLMLGCTKPSANGQAYQETDDVKKEELFLIEGKVVENIRMSPLDGGDFLILDSQGKNITIVYNLGWGLCKNHNLSWEPILKPIPKGSVVKALVELESNASYTSCTSPNSYIRLVE